MTTLQIVLGLLAVVLLLAWWWTRQRGGAAASERGNADRIDTVTGWPPQPTRVLSTPERLAFNVLTRALPGHMVLAQVPLSRFLNVPRRNSYADWLRRIGNQCADFVVCDINMPNMNGFEFLKAVRADDALKHIPVLMVTAEARKEDIVLAAQTGASGYIVKPFTKATLEEKVQKIVQKLGAAA